MGPNALVEDTGIDEGYCVGTFRWRPGKRFPSLPAHEKSKQPECLASAVSWNTFLLQRGGKQLVDAALRDKSIIDCLSFPLTTVYAIEQIRELTGSRVSCIVVVGASYKAEVRIFGETKYWAEVENILGRPVKLFFVGPEAIRDEAEPTGSATKVYRGTAVEFFLKRKDVLVGGKTMVIGFNPGFGSGSEDLLRSWCADLRFLASTCLPCVFTCASDYSDLRGETLVLNQFVGCRFLLKPARNPFHMALTTVAQEDSSLWSCGNSFLYGFRGLDHKVSRSIDTSRQKMVIMLRLLQAFSKDSKWTIADMNSVQVDTEATAANAINSSGAQTPDLWTLE